MSNTRNSRQMADGSRQFGRRQRLLRPAHLLRRAAYCLLLTAICLLAAGCRQDMQDQPRYEYYEPGDTKFFPEALAKNGRAVGASSRRPVEGTVPRQPGEYRDSEDYFFTGKVAGQAAGGAQTGAGASTNVGSNTAGGVPGAREAAATGGPDNFPVNVDMAALQRGRERFQIFCSACHGITGEGDGLIVRRGFRRPPSFYDDRLQEGVTPASHFFDVITNGWGAMPDYAESIPPEDRWKIIAYLRALQLSRRLKLEDLSPEERERVTSSAQQQPAAGHGQGGTPSESPQTGGEKH
jgi:mono/diheme cytochrome c family protein